MRRTFPALPALAVALVIALVAALVALAMAGPSGQDRASGDLVAAAASSPDDDPDEGADGDDSGPPSGKAKTQARHGSGPPPWAHGRRGQEHRAGKRAHAEWQQRWHGMSQQQREATMRRLSEEHAAGMKAWAKCHAEGRDDCSKPMPPGLAKKQ